MTELGSAIAYWWQTRRDLRKWTRLRSALQDCYPDFDVKVVRAAKLAAADALVEDMYLVQKAARLGLIYHSSGPGYTEEILNIATAAIARTHDA